MMYIGSCRESRRSISAFQAALLRQFSRSRDPVMSAPRRSPGVLVLGANEHGQLAAPALDAQRRVSTATAVPSAAWGVNEVTHVACGRWHTVVASAYSGVFSSSGYRN